MTSGVEALLAVYGALSPEERAEALALLRRLRVEEGGEAEREMDAYLRSLRRVAEALGHAPGVAEYQAVAATLREEG